MKCDNINCPICRFGECVGDREAAREFGWCNKSPEEKEEQTCRTCAHRERWQMGGSVIQYCGARRSSRTQNGLRKIKVTDKACALYKDD